MASHQDRGISQASLLRTVFNLKKFLDTMSHLHFRTEVNCLADHAEQKWNAQVMGGRIHCMPAMSFNAFGLKLTM